MTIISEENKVVLVKRVKSLLWRAGAAAAVVLLSQGTELLDLLVLPDWAVLLVSLVAGEVTKMLNVKK